MERRLPACSVLSRLEACAPYALALPCPRRAPPYGAFRRHAQPPRWGGHGRSCPYKLNRARLQLIRSDAVLVLISRAHLVDFEALTEMVLQGRFRAAIDVFPTEPLPPQHPIRGARHAILSSHHAGGTTEAYRNIGRLVVNDLEAILRGLAPQEMQKAQPEYIAQRG